MTYLDSILDCIFWSKVHKTDTCWLWRGRYLGNGYGVVSVAGMGIYAHRFSLELNNGREIGNLSVCHHCDNKMCVRPDHLFMGTQADNGLDYSRKYQGLIPSTEHFVRKAPRTHCQKGHPLTPDNLKVFKSGVRQCAICRRAAVARCRQRHREKVAALRLKSAS